MGAQHDGRARGYDGDVVNEDDAKRLKVLDDELIVHDLVVAKDGWLEDARHPIEGLDGLLNPGAESPRGREYDLVDFHVLQGSGLVQI